MSFYRGWKSIKAFTQLSRESILKLYREEGFPMKRIAGQFTIWPDEVHAWFQNYNDGNIKKNSTQSGKD